MPPDYPLLKEKVRGATTGTMFPALPTRTWAAFSSGLTAVLLTLLVAAAAVHAAPLSGSAYDSGDGDQADGLGIDWQGAAGAGAVKESPDANDDCFVGGVKELTPDQWAFDRSAGGCTPGKSNLRVAYTNPESGAATTFGHFAFFRNDTTGNSFLTFELNQSPSTWTNATGTTIPCRSNGDLLLSIEVGGSSMATSLYRWTGDGTGPVACPDGANGTLAGSGTIPGSRFQGAMNGSMPISNFVNPGAYGATFPTNSFGEAAIDLPAVLQSMGASPCFGFLQMQVHSRSSTSISSAMIDYTSPVPVHIQSCAATGTQYQDTNGNGTRDSGEPGLAGFRMYADLDDDGTWDASEPSGVSDATGFYRILDIPAGSAKIRQVARSGWRCSQPAPCEYARSFTTSGNSTGNDFGNLGPSTASGTAFDDSDGDGTRDAGEPALADLEVFADLDGDGVLDAGEPGATSDGAGAWTVADVPAGTYAIRPVTPAGRTCSTACSHTSLFSSGSSVTGIEFGSWAAGAIGGAVTESGGAPVAGVQVFLDADGDDAWDLGESQTTTSATGLYALSTLAPGDYAVRVTLPSPGWYGEGAAEHAVTLTSGVTAGGRDFTLARYATVSGATWDDVDGDGVGPEAGEAGLAGFTVWVDYDGDDAIDAGEPAATSATGGAYTITGVRAGTWTLREAPNGAYRCTQPSPCAYGLTLASGGTATGRSFGNYVSRSVSGTVYGDADADGIVGEPGEAGLTGWTVYSDEDSDGVHDPLEPVDVSNSLGVYNLTGLANGNYRIRLVAQAGWTCSYPASCLNTGSIGSGQSDTARDFGVWGPATIAGTVSEDADADGAGDGPLAGRTVYVDSDDDAIHDAGEPSATSGASGAYAIPGLSPGTYRVRQVLPGGWTCSRPSPCSYTVVTSAGGLTGRDFASYTGGAISGTVREDTDADGTGDAGLAGRTLFLDGDGDGAHDPGEPSTTSDGAGAYSFIGLAPGGYSVRQALAPGWTQSAPAAGHTVTVSSGSSSAGRDFASWTTASVAGTLFEDADFDGSAREGGDPGVTGRVVYLDADADGTKDAGEQEATSDGTGGYAFTGLEPGSYSVRPVLPSDWACSFPATCAAAVTVASGDAASGHDFGSYVGASVSGTVFEDLDADGAARAAGEPGFPGRRVYLDADGDAIRDASEPSAVTAADGTFAFDGIVAQAWQLRLELDGAYACDSPAPCRVDLILTSGVASSGHAFGVHTTGTIAGHLFTDRDADGQSQVFGENDQPERTVWLDADDDGVLDAGEATDETDDGGDYLFTGVPPGTHRVRQVLPGGWTCSTPAPCVREVILSSGEAESGHDFSSWTTASFSGVYFEDADADGEYPEPGESGVAGRSVYLDEDDDGAHDAGEPETTTAGDGSFAFAGLEPRAYVVRSRSATAWTCSYPDPCAAALTLEAGERAQDVSFGAWTTGTVTGTVSRDGGGAIAGSTVYADADGDGVHDAAEPSDVTDAGGAYALTVEPGDHVVRHVLAGGWTCTSPQPCERAVTVASRETVADQDFSDAPPPAGVSGTVYEDLDGDGTRDAGEPGAEGLTVSAGAHQATTAADGTYAISPLAAGEYELAVSAVADWICPAACSRTVTLADGGSETFDVAVWRPATISGTVFVDSDADGAAREAGEPGAEGVGVFLDEDGDGAHDAGEPTTTTAGSGAYALAGVAPGVHGVRVVVPAGEACLRPDPCRSTVTTTSGSTPAADDFGLAPVTADLRTSVTLPATAGAGEVVDLAVAVSNAGPFDADDVSVAVTLPDGLDPAAPLPAGCTAAGRVVTCTAPGIAVGDTPAWTIPVRVGDDARADLPVEATATAATPDPTPPDATATASLTPVPAADVRVDTETEPHTVAGGYEYSFTVRNDGPSTATGVVVADGPFPGATIASATTDRGTCTIEPDGSLRCELGDLADGEQASITIVLELGDGVDPESTRPQPAATAGEADPSPENNERQMALPPAPPAPTPEPEQARPEPDPDPLPEPRIEVAPELLVQPAQVQRGGCASSRAFRVRVRRYSRLRLRRVTMRLDGTRLRVRRRRGRFVSFVDLRGRPPGRYVLRIRAVTATGRVLKRTRTYTTCSDTLPYDTPPL